MKSLLPQPKNRSRSVLIRGAALMAFLAIILFTLPDFARSVLESAAAPLFRAGVWANGGVERLFELFSNKRALIAENERLRREFSDLSVRLLDRNELYEENVALKETFGRDASVNALLAAVLARPPRAPYDTLVLDAGTAEGVSIGDFVAASETLIVGRIAAVSAETSVARLFSAPGTETEVLLGQKGPALIARGRGGGSFSADVPVGIEVVIGESVRIPTITPHVFAVVERVAFNPSDLSRTVFFRLPVNPFELRFVNVFRHAP